MSDRDAGTPTPLKRIVIKEELVALTGDYIKAIILNQFLYWSQRTYDYDRFLLEEKTRDPDLEVELTYGWIYKSADELVDETMLGCSGQTMRRHLEPLIAAGWLAERRNPRYNWDRTYQYRPDILAIQRDLQTLGYALDGYPLLIEPPSSKMENGISTVENGTSKMENQSSKLEDQSSILSDRSHDFGGALPEITTEITPETTAEIKRTGAGAPGPAAAPDEAETPAQDPARATVAGLRERLGSDPLGMAAHCDAAREEAGGEWTIPREAGGADPYGEAMLAAWFRVKRVDPTRVPDKAKEQFRRQLGRLAEGHDQITVEMAVRAVEIVLDPNNPDFNYYRYSNPAIEKFKRDWEDVVLQLLSGNSGYRDRPGNGNCGDKPLTGLDALQELAAEKGYI